MDSSRAFLDATRLFNQAETLARSKNAEANALLTARDNAETAKKEALDAKANLAAKEMYGWAEEAYKKAQAAELSGDTEGAKTFYAQAAELYAKARDAAVEKRQKAEAALKAAQEKKAQSEQKARDAEETIKNQ